MSVQNRNQTVEWCLQQKYIKLDNRLLQFDPPVRGIYGIFIKDKGQEKCVYVGKAENLYNRMFKSDGHIVNIKKGIHFNSQLKQALEQGQEIIIEVLKEVPYKKGDISIEDYNRDMQNLASAEYYYIDFYQKMGECLWQLPEGKHLSFDEWCKKKEVLNEYE